MKINKENLNIVWIGFHEEGRYCIEELYKNGFNVSAIFTLNESEKEKRAGVFNYQPQSKKYQIPIFEVKHINDDSSIQRLIELKPDIIFVIGWSQILDAKALATAEWVVGAHASKLPENRGSAPINWSLIKGQKSTGNTLIRLLEGVDTGDILAQREFTINVFDSCKTLYDKVAISNSEMVVDFCYNVLEGTVNEQKQSRLDEALLPRRKPEHGLIDWSRSSEEIYNFIRAQVKPYPGAFFIFQNQKCKVWSCAWNPYLNEKRENGTIHSVNYSFKPELCSVNVACSSGLLMLHELEVDGKTLIGKSLIEFLKPGLNLNEKESFSHRSSP